MNPIFSLISLGIGVLQNILEQHKKADAPVEIIAGIESAIVELQKVHSLPLSEGQLESLRVDIPTWGN